MESAPSAKVRVLFFARYAELVGREEAALSIPLPATVNDVVCRVRAELPRGHELPERPLTAVNQRHVRLEAPIADGDEVALLPPVAGG